MLKRLVTQGRLGKKSGQGFFTYPQPDSDSSYETIALWTFFYGMAGENDDVVRVPGVRATCRSRCIA